VNRLELCILTAVSLAATSTMSHAQVPSKQRVAFADPMTSARSGVPGIATRLEAKSQYQYLIGLVAWESKDKPCKVTARFAHVNQLNEFEQTWTDPGCKSPGSKLTFDTHEPNGTFFLTRLNACMAKNNDRVKGVKGLGVAVDRAHLLADVYRPGAHVDIKGETKTIDGFRRPHCDGGYGFDFSGWEPGSQCDADRVATGIVIEHKDGSWTSLRLICSLVIPKS
jgi:hypothetical protein